MIATYRAAMDKGYHTNKTILSNYKPPFTVDWSPFMGRALDRRRRHARADGDAQGAGRRPDRRCPEASSCIRASRRSSPTAARWARASCRSTGAWARRSPTRRCSTRATACASPARTSAAARSSHRHAVLHDQNRENGTRAPRFRCSTSSDEPADFEIIDSVLTEEAVLGFEYGYSTSDPNALVDLGSAVRRLRQRRAGRHRPVHQLGRSEVGPHLRARAAAAARLRRAGPRAFVGAARALPAAVRRAQHAGVRAVDARADVPHAAPADAAPLPQAAHRDDAEEPAAPQGSGVVARRARQRPVPDRHRRSRRARRRRRCSASSCAAARSTTSCSRTGASSKIDDVAIIRLEQQYPFPHDDFKARARAVSRTRRKSCGARKSRRTRARGIGSAPTCAPTSPTQKVLAYAGRPVSASPAVGYAAKHLAAAEAADRGRVRAEAAIGRDGRARTEAQ